MSMLKRTIYRLVPVFLFVALLPFPLSSLSVGQKVWSLKIKNADNGDAWIPFMGSRVLTIIYSDPDASDVSDPVADALKAKDFPKTIYKAVGIANTKDTWKPNVAIRAVVRSKIAKYKSTILLDTDKTVSKSWGLGNCNDKSVIIVIGKDRIVKYVTKLGSQADAHRVKGAVIAAIEAAIAADAKKK